MNLGRTLNTYLIAVAFSANLSGTATGSSILSIAFTIKWHGLVRFYEGLRRGATYWPGKISVDIYPMALPKSIKYA